MQGKGGAAQIVSEDSVAQSAADYLAATFDVAFGIHTLYQNDAMWLVRIHYSYPEAKEPIVVGTLRVEQSGQVVPLTMAEIAEFQERAMILGAHRQQELARDKDGYILPTQAKVEVTGYVGEQIAFFAAAEGQPQWIAGTPPVWRVATALRLRGQGNVCDLGFVDVNALTGDVVPLSEKEITLRQKRAHHAAEANTRSAAATG